MGISENYQCNGQMSIWDMYSQDTWFGKTSPVHSAQTKERTSERCLKKPQGSQKKMPLFLNLTKGSGHQADALWEMGGPLLGEYMTHSFGECPKDARESLLSQILEETPHQKYSLSAKACQGILNRAERRGKEIPQTLKEALINQSTVYRETESTEPIQPDAMEMARDYKDPQVIYNGGALSFQERGGKPGGGKGILIQHERLGALSTLNNQMVFDASRRHNYEPFGDVSETVQAHYGTGGGNVPVVLTIGHDERTAKMTSDGKTDHLTANDYKDPIKVSYGNKVRRVTPTECERLQGYPDGWTDIGDWVDSKGKKHKGDSDAPRYKALGNSIALPFWQWMARRMLVYLGDNPTMGSLFDGIGGFPLAFSRCGCRPIWASEIEEFPIAVTKKRFSEESEE